MMTGKHYNGHEVSCCIKYFIFGFNIIFWVRPCFILTWFSSSFSFKAMLGCLFVQLLLSKRYVFVKGRLCCCCWCFYRIKMNLFFLYIYFLPINTVASSLLLLIQVGLIKTKHADNIDPVWFLFSVPSFPSILNPILVHKQRTSFLRLSKTYENFQYSHFKRFSLESLHFCQESIS